MEEQQQPLIRVWDSVMKEERHLAQSVIDAIQDGDYTDRFRILGSEPVKPYKEVEPVVTTTNDEAPNYQTPNIEQPIRESMIAELKAAGVKINSNTGLAKVEAIYKETFNK